MASLDHCIALKRYLKQEKNLERVNDTAGLRQTALRQMVRT